MASVDTYLPTTYQFLGGGTYTNRPVFVIFFQFLSIGSESEHFEGMCVYSLYLQFFLLVGHAMKRLAADPLPVGYYYDDDQLWCLEYEDSSEGDMLSLNEGSKAYDSSDHVENNENKLDV